MDWRKRWGGLGIIASAILIIVILVLESHSPTEDKKNTEEFQQYYKIYALSAPKSISFAGTKISLADFDVAERYDKEILTNVYWQSQTVLLLKRANRFLPTIEKILKEQQIPADFKYVALAESGLQNVVSPANAAGFWQFLDKTGKRYGLEISEEVDERYHLEKATYAACAYFKESYAQLRDWSLVAASYNMGIEGVKKQMRAQSINNYFDLYLNTETSRYLFRIIAIKDICENPERFGFHVGINELYWPVSVVHVKVDLSITSLAQWSIDNNCNYKLVKLLNPWLRKPYINVPVGKTYYIALPKDRILKSAVANKVKNDTLRFDDSNQENILKEDLITLIEHIVVKGETVQILAKKYSVTEEDILTWNELNEGTTLLKPSSKIIIRKAKIEQ
ncbi:MAG: transglycosylase SLT domain-containing protein [Bacteroidia bacterium]|nr:transglycosylase SLT domain-containing protein [Bacteroidia bacterium]MCF8446787.1 transglycosylase SLT domain-containing protein [Bacteroidia bacterium]